MTLDSMCKSKIEKLEWDSDFFGLNIARLCLGQNCGNLNLSDLLKEEKSIDLVECCCDVSQRKNIVLLESLGFNYIGLKIDFMSKIELSKIEEIRIQVANRDDIPELKKIAAKIFHKSRYYNEFFKRDKADELYQVWIEKAVLGLFDDCCLKAEDNEEITGFATIKNLSRKKSRIGLLGVSPSFRGRGIGEALLSQVKYFLSKDTIQEVYVATQGSNIHAQNFYIKNGFFIKGIFAWYYKRI